MQNTLVFNHPSITRVERRRREFRSLLYLRFCFPKARWLEKNKCSSTSIKKLSLNLILKSFWISAFISITFLLVFYLFQLTAVVSESYRIQNLQKKINEFSEENKMLEINIAQINSLENIEDKIQQLGFEKVGKIHYIQILESSVVAK